MSKGSVNRLSRYKSALYRLRHLGLVKVFSDNIADAVGVTSAQVRKDFSLFEITGNKRGGYQVEHLLERLNAILGKNEIQKVIIVGLGKIGAALMNYSGFEKDGIRIVAAFEIDPVLFDREADVPILPLDDLKSFVAAEKIRIGIIATPDHAAQQALDVMVDAGIKGILNFAPIRLRVPEECVIRSVDLGHELEKIIYFVQAGTTSPGKEPSS